MPSLSFLITIFNKGDDERFRRFFASEDASVGLQLLGRGTATQEVLDLLGLGETEKHIWVSSMTSTEAKRVTHALNDALKLSEPGAIAFSIAHTSVGNLFGLEEHFGFDNKFWEESKVDGKGNSGSSEAQQHTEDASDVKYELIMVIANQGYIGTIMDAARAAGATGGTTIHAGGTYDPKHEHFFNITIQHEKEVIMILVPSNLRRGVMSAILAVAGGDTKANAVAFSLHVTDTAGLRK
ncbi:MAG: hypothetical protein LBD16_09590 [Oscillospiraceae bacterium]|jgi:hypothetical protein|nr:hypothetical protein [Oscillospiraceae bacterium]